MPILQDEIWRKTQKLLAAGRMRSALFGYNKPYHIHYSMVFKLSSRLLNFSDLTFLLLYSVPPTAEQTVSQEQKKRFFVIQRGSVFGYGYATSQPPTAGIYSFSVLFLCFLLLKILLLKTKTFIAAKKITKIISVSIGLTGARFASRSIGNPSTIAGKF